MDAVVSREHRNAAAHVRAALATLAATEDARALGIEPGDGRIQAAIAAQPAIDSLLRQGRGPATPARTLAMLFETADTLREPHEYCL